MVVADFYLICFAIGFIFSVLSFALGIFHWHLPHGIHTHLMHPGHGGPNASHGTHFSLLNPAILSAFLAWFGATGYLLATRSRLWFGVGLMIAFAGGAAGAGIIYLFLSRVLFSQNENMDSSHYQMVGVLGRTSVQIREGGTGEIIYSQAGTRRTCGARSEDGSAIPRNSDVVVLRYENGIAYVRPWSEIADEAPALTAKETKD